MDATKEKRAATAEGRDAGSVPPGPEDAGAGTVAAASADYSEKALEGLGPNYGVKHRQ